MKTHTPGPWQWTTRSGRTVSLVHPHAGWLTVMDFVRLGMQGGTMRLAVWKDDERANMGGIMKPAHEIELDDHPDARLMVASPDMLHALRMVQRYGSSGDTDDGFSVSHIVAAAVRLAEEGRKS